MSGGRVHRTVEDVEEFWKALVADPDFQGLGFPERGYATEWAEVKGGGAARVREPRPVGRRLPAFQRWGRLLARETAEVADA